MITLSVFAAGLLQRHQHVRRLGHDPGAGGVRLPVAVAAFHDRLDLVQARLQALGGVLHPDVRAFHHLFGRQAAPGGRYHRRHGLAGVRVSSTVVRQHHARRRLLRSTQHAAVGRRRRRRRRHRQRERGLGAPLARRTGQRYGHQRFQLGRRRLRRRRVLFREQLFVGAHDVLRGVHDVVVLFGHRPDVQRGTGYDLERNKKNKKNNQIISTYSCNDERNVT